MRIRAPGGRARFGQSVLVSFGGDALRFEQCLVERVAVERTNDPHWSAMELAH